MASVSALRLLIDARGAAAGAAAFSRATGQVTASATQATAATNGLMASLKPLAAFVGIAATIKTIADFEEKITLAGEVARATAGELQALTDRARELGATTRFSGAEAAEGLLELSRAGFSVDESMAAIKDSLDLATAGGLELGEATGYMANSIRQFGLEADDAAMVASTFTTVSNNANTTVAQLAEAMKYAGTVASSVGFSIQETAAIIGALGDRGVQASMAGTQLRGAILALASPTDKTHDALAKLNISFSDVNPAMNDSQKIAHALKRGFDSLKNPLDAAGIASDIFGRRNASAALAMADATDKMQENIAAAHATHSAHTDLARAMEQTVIGQFKALISALQELMLGLGDSGVTGALKAMMSTMTETVRMLAGTKDAFREASIQAKALAAAILLVSVRFAWLAGSAIVGFVTAGWAAVRVAFVLNSGMVLASVNTWAWAGAWRALTAAMLSHPITAVIAALTIAATWLFFSAGAAREAEAAAAAYAEKNKQLAKRIDDVRMAEEGLARAREKGDKRAEIQLIKERIKQVEALQRRLKEGTMSERELMAGLTREDARAVGVDRTAPTLPPLLQGEGFDSDPADMLAAVLRDLNLRLLKIDESAAEAANALTVAENAQKSWHDEMKAGSGILESALSVQSGSYEDMQIRVEALTQIQKFNADATVKLVTEDVLPAIEAEIRARKDLEKQLQDQSKAERDAAAESAKAARALESKAKALAQLKVKQDDYLEHLVAILQLMKAGDTEGAMRAQIALDIIERGIPLLSVQGMKLFDLRLQQAGLNDDIAAAATITKEYGEGVEDWILTQNDANDAAQAQLDLQHLIGPEYDKAIERARILAEFTRQEAIAREHSGESLEEDLRLLREARDVALENVDALEELRRKRDVQNAWASSMANAFMSIVDGSKSAKDAFKDMAISMLSYIAEMHMRMLAFKIGSGFGMVPGAGGGTDAAAKGYAYDDGEKVTRYQYGGVVGGPTMFGTRAGLGLMGEAGPEAILPLRRGRDGRLGVESGGGGGQNVVVNMTVNTKDADSFRRSRVQIQDDLKRVTTNLPN